MQGEAGHRDVRVPSLRCIPVSDSKFPKLLDSDWVAPNATIIGDVHLAEGSSLWHGAILRGDTAKIQVGKNSVIQDNTQVRSSNGDEVSIGDNVFVGANCKIDSCSLESFAFVGMGATVAKGATVQSYAVVAAGSHVPEDTVVPSGQVFAGSPAKYLRDLT
jgi:carbonic anhydrase/acetyltransferase-like protein (isoleucine patch superfamily)